VSGVDADALTVYQLRDGSGKVLTDSTKAGLHGDIDTRGRDAAVVQKADDDAVAVLLALPPRPLDRREPRACRIPLGRRPRFEPVSGTTATRSRSSVVEQRFCNPRRSEKPPEIRGFSFLLQPYSPLPDPLRGCRRVS
jgi:hypothetical protein